MKCLPWQRFIILIQPPYKLQDMKAEAIKGRFYAEELQKISKRSDDYWHVEKVLKTKGSGRKKEYYVKWKASIIGSTRGQSSMDEVNDFYVTLPSNSSLSFFPKKRRQHSERN
ncbi:chromo domain-containing protein [Trichonephila clavata]|uniref:Chromo domain-containing protein n=1 Tax=Trichonephila clavata TaxID=2740835 RepID=A0A8X6I0Q8_TRICU|nr:chromo domain-containing protein [Trichonephila clavata]